MASVNDLTPDVRSALSFIGANHLAPRGVIEEQCFGGASSESLLQKLMEAGFVEGAKVDSGVWCYWLTTATLTQLGLPLSRSSPPGGRGLWSALGVGCFVWFARKKRFRLLPSEVGEFFALTENERVQTPHVFEPSEKGPRIYRVYVPDEATPDSEIMRTVRDHLKECRKDKRFETGIRERYYGFAVVVDTGERQMKLKKDFQDAELNKQLHLIVEQWPGLQRLNEALIVRKRKQDSIDAGTVRSASGPAAKPDPGGPPSIVRTNAGNGTRVPRRNRERRPTPGGD